MAESNMHLDLRGGTLKNNVLLRILKQSPKKPRKSPGTTKKAPMQAPQDDKSK